MTSQERRLQVPGTDLAGVTAAITAALAGRYTVDPGRVESVTRTPLETFDHRLAAAGMSLYVQRAGSSTVLVMSIPGGATLTSPADGFAPPAVSERLPPGAVRDAVSGVMKLRAVIPGSPQRHRLRTLTIRDDETKAVARVELDAVTGDGLTRLTVVPVRGYDRAGARVLSLLGRLPGAEAGGAAEATPPEEAPPVPPLTPDTPAPQAVADVVAGYLATMRANLDGVVDDIDTEFLHDFRVAVRRTRSTLKLSREALDPVVVRRREADGKRLGDLTTPLRDLDVHLLGLPTMRGWLVSADPADLAAFEEHLRSRRAVAHRTLVRALRTKRAQEFLTDWTGELVTTAGERAQVRAEDLSRHCISRAHKKVVKVGSKIDADSPAEDLHTLRKRCKELRYALEMFTPLHDPDTTGKAIADLKKLQDVLGRFQDAEVQQHAVRAFAEEMTAAGTAPAATLLAMGELVTHLEADQAAARSDFTGAFERFMRPASTRRLRAMGTGGTQ